MDDNNNNERLTNIETRLDAAEQDLVKLRKSVHDIKDEQQILVGQMNSAQQSLEAIQGTVNTVNDNISHIKNFIDGTDKIAGFCRKHWRTILKFGCGFITAYGVSNPKVGDTVAFVSHFFGL